MAEDKKFHERLANDGRFRGSIGSQGIQGIEGEKGRIGDSGQKGIRGERGSAGKTGPQGKQGKSADFQEGSVVAFALSSCPNGWQEYKPAYGKFIRGIDKSGDKIDPDGYRNPGDPQEDTVGSHSHTFPTLVHGSRGGTISTGDAPISDKRSDYEISDEKENESRPKNVACLYCIKLKPL